MLNCFNTDHAYKISALDIECKLSDIFKYMKLNIYFAPRLPVPSSPPPPQPLYSHSTKSEGTGNLFQHCMLSWTGQSLLNLPTKCLEMGEWGFFLFSPAFVVFQFISIFPYLGNRWSQTVIVSLQFIILITKYWTASCKSPRMPMLTTCYYCQNSIKLLYLLKKESVQL